jgi:hypothetical protein
MKTSVGMLTCKYSLLLGAGGSLHLPLRPMNKLNQAESIYVSIAYTLYRVIVFKFFLCRTMVFLLIARSLQKIHLVGLRCNVATRRLVEKFWTLHRRVKMIFYFDYNINHHHIRCNCGTKSPNGLYVNIFFCILLFCN